MNKILCFLLSLVLPLCAGGYAGFGCSASKPLERSEFAYTEGTLPPGFEWEAGEGADAENHPANRGLDFAFQDRISRDVLQNYLSRSMTVSPLFSGDFSRVNEDMRMIFHTGAKYISRASTAWAPNGAEYQYFGHHKALIAKAHEADPALVFEACIFETAYPSVDEIAIPDWVFRAFGRAPERRNFSHEKMLFRDGSFVDHFGPGFSMPDITRLETRMFFYYRACVFIDLGYEALHMGQVHPVGSHDFLWWHWTRLLTMIRAYARQYARRGFVLLNAHTHGIRGFDGRLLFDFHAWPTRGGASPEGAVPHPPTQADPQVIELRAGYKEAIFGQSKGGRTHSGWRCASLPFYVELDNWDGYDPDKLDFPVDEGNFHWWGFDEISWYANQPKEYRQAWLADAWRWVRETDPAGFLCMPGNRTAALRDPEDPYVIRQLTYQCNNAEFDPAGFDDETAIRRIWLEDRAGR
ncbi:MAG: hypothetical protein LBB75_04930 [Oscillospiraceae bacterium]|jgi:hypothetical protein|nr:hypothetical protein [Oscillospiraceae bacterium]